MTFLVFSGWSAVSANLSKEYGFVVSSSADWGLDLCTYPMSIMVTIILKSYGTMLFARYLEMTKKKKFFFFLFRLRLEAFVQPYLENGL